MDKRHLLAIAGALAVVAGLALTASAEVRTRVYSASAPAATDGRVVTRDIGEKTPPCSGWVPFALSIVPVAELPPEDWSVAGFRLNLFAGRHRDLWGVDVGGLGNELTGTLTGLQGAGLWNRVGQADAAVQAAGIANLCERDFCGLQTAGIYNWAGGEMMGVQVALLNRASGFRGVQAGLYNEVDNGSGLQIGLINSARELAGLQIGLVNVNRDSTLPFFPIVNLAF